MLFICKSYQRYHHFFYHFFSQQKKETVGGDDTLPASVTSDLLALTKESCEALTVTQIKKVRALLDEAMEANKADLERLAKERDEVCAVVL